MTRSSKLKLGGFVAAALAGLSGLVVLFGGAPRLFDSRSNYVVTFADAPGIALGVPVRKSGVRIGEVTAIDLDPATGKVRVGIAVDSKYLPRQNEDATINRSLLTNDTSLDFIPKTTPDGQPISTFAEAISPNTEISGVTPFNPNTLVKQATGVLPTAQESLLRILNSVQRFEQTLPKVEKAFDEVGALARSGREFVPELRRTNDKIQSLISVDEPQGEGLRATLAELRETLKVARPLIDDVRKLVKENSSDITETVKAVKETTQSISDILNADNRKAFNEIIKNFNESSADFTKLVKIAYVTLDSANKTIGNINDRVTTAERVLKEAEKAFTSVDTAMKPIAANSDAILKNVAGAADALAKSLVDVRTLLGAANRGDGTLQRILVDPSLYNNLNTATVALTQTLQRADKVAADLQVFADKIARRPELIGVGGALRPSSGLKEAPCAPTGPVIPPTVLESFKPEPIPPSR